MSKIFSFSLDKGTTFSVVAIIAVTVILMWIFYSIATRTYPQFIIAKPPTGFGNFSLLKPPIGNYTGPLITPFPANVTHKVVNKYGWHPCVEDVGVWCLGHYKVNETIIISKPSIPQCIGPGCPPLASPLPPDGGAIPQAYDNNNTIRSFVPEPPGLPKVVPFWAKAIHKTIPKYGLHLCADDPNLMCVGPYNESETIIIYSGLPQLPLNITPPPSRVSSVAIYQ